MCIVYKTFTTPAGPKPGTFTSPRVMAWDFNLHQLAKKKTKTMVSFVTTNIIGTATKKIDMFWNFVSGCMSILWGNTHFVLSFC